jgi:putative nucleotidyltransferase with HDIG domain
MDGTTLDTDARVGAKLAAPGAETAGETETLRPRALVARARELVEAQPLLTQLASRSGAPERLWSRLACAPLPSSVLARLTTARDRNPQLYEHSLRAAWSALALGGAAKLPDRELELLATAALLHDIGMLHTDPAQFDGARPLDAAARRQLHAHPLTGMLIAQREPELNPAIATAIAQHHERLDGTGYPSGLPAEKISRLARVLMLVEIVLAVVEHHTLPELQLSLILRVNHRSFDPALAQLLLAALPRVEAPGAAENAQDGLRAVARTLAEWRQVSATCSAGAAQEIAAFIGQRVAQVQRWLAEAGIDPFNPSVPDADDPLIGAELGALLREALWQLRQLAADTGARWPQLASDHATVGPALAGWIKRAADPLAG